MGIFDFLKGNKKTKLEKTEIQNETIQENSNCAHLKNSLPDELKSQKEIILSDDEIQKYINQEILERTSFEENSRLHISDFDSLFEDAAKIIISAQQGSASLLQRKLKLGYNRAGRLIDELESAGVIGPFEGSKARNVLISDLNELETIIKLGETNGDRLNHFKQHILPLKEEFIAMKINDFLKAKEILEENNLKQILKKEILDKENERIEKERIKGIKAQLRKELIEEGILANLNKSDSNKREQISQDVLDSVWNRDGGKCVVCGSQEKIEFDHIIPFSKGGSNTYRNIQILCEKCNRTKSNKIK